MAVKMELDNFHKNLLIKTIDFVATNKYYKASHEERIALQDIKNRLIFLK